jgi:predicted ribosomally synthesized peptide with nif11-like leader
MSTEIVRQFLLAVSSESALQEKLAATDSVNFVKMAQESGYSFTLEDLQAYLAQHNNGELSEDELEAVAGGMHGSDIPLLLSFSIRDDVCAPGGNGSVPKGPGPRPGRGPGTGPF